MAITVGLLIAALGFQGPACSQSFDYEREIDQGWTDHQRKLWYSATQGSRLIPLDWLMALEQPGRDARFMDPAHIASFGYLPQKSVKGDDWMIGLAVDDSDDSKLVRTQLRWREVDHREQWVGMTCAACHTGQLVHGGKTLRIDGGQAFSDFQGFMEAMGQALKETLAEPKWSRFAKRVLGSRDAENRTVHDTLENRGDLKAALEKLTAWQTRELAVNDAPLRYGFGRVDAFGHIYNKVALLADDKAPTTYPADAPVSIPFIWRAPQLERVQYNGIAPKYDVLFGTSDVGALARNAGEVIGVFGDVVLDGTTAVPSSIQVDGLVRLEELLATLRPPKWPEALGRLDEALLRQGGKLYNERCVGCHDLVRRDDLEVKLSAKRNLFEPDFAEPLKETRREAPGTDIWMACNAFDRAAPSGKLKGWLLKIGEHEPMSTLLGATVGSALLGKTGDVLKETARQFFGIKADPRVVTMKPASRLGLRRTKEKQEQFDRCMETPSTELGYTSRALNGIWATAPYLHNGSVASLDELLLPPDERRRSFWVGTRAFDPDKVGLAIHDRKPETGNAFEFRARDDSGVPIDGNSNEGHDYDNKSLSPADRKALIEYLKSL